MGVAGEVLIGLGLLVGLIGTVLFVFPGLLIQVGSLLVWAILADAWVPWVIAIIGALIAATATLIKYLIPGKRLKDAGVPAFVLLPSALLAIVGFFVIPVVGAPIFFVGAVYLIELIRVGASEAWPTTKASVAAVAMSVGIEFAAAFLILGLWVGTVFLT